jgi:CMP-N,N'-diacetyllegionaminic acid synthase
MKKNEYGEILALIPARGGSKSVPRKNIIKLHGKPMIAWAIEHAIASQFITRVIVTTDDEEIAEIAREYGAEVPFLRPADISGDYSVDVEFHSHALKWLKENENYIPEMVVNLRPTPPSRLPETIDMAIEKFAKHKEADSLRSVHLSSETPFKMWFLDESGYMKSIASLPNLSEPYNQPRQKLPLVYWQDGYIDITRPSVIFEKNSTTGDVILPFIVEEPAVDIDYPESIEIAEAQLREKDNLIEAVSNKLNDIRHPS